MTLVPYFHQSFLNIAEQAIAGKYQNVASNETNIQLLQQQQQLAAINDQIHNMQMQLDDVLHKRLENIEVQLDNAEQQREYLGKQVQARYQHLFLPQIVPSHLASALIANCPTLADLKKKRLVNLPGMCRLEIDASDYPRFYRGSALSQSPSDSHRASN